MGLVSNKVALAAGAAAGIGRATTLQFAHEGAKIVVSDVNSVGSEESVRLIGQSSGEAVFIKADVSKPEDFEALIV